ncbi:MAG: peptidoglycan -binding protein [Bauldia sp.]|nr:peptidoglycan -binding protein [Bauldia sp.]
MASGARGRRRGGGLDYWPAFVDVLSNLLLVFIFLLSVFAVVQFLLNTEIGERDTLLDQLRDQIATLTDTLAMERTEEADLTATIATLTQNLATAVGERDRLAGVVATNQAAADAAGGQVTTLTTQLTDQQLLTQRALSQVEILNQQIAALRAQLAAIENALGIAETQRADNEARIAELGARLNLALQERVEELSRYRSDFFGRLSEILGNREDIQIVGDRFVFRSDVLFEVGSAALNDAGRQQLVQLATAIRQLEAEIPADIPWVLQVNGHTDAQPMRAGGEFASNWELSTARALSVVELLQAEGVSPERLAAAGFGEYQPLEEGTTADIYARNRRIELKLTE